MIVSDQEDRITEQLDVVSSVGLRSRFVGITTDSRLYMSFRRHESFRRMLCDWIGVEVERSELPNDGERLGRLIASVCYGNVASFFRVRPAKDLVIQGSGDIGRRSSAAYNLGKIDSLKAVAGCRPLLLSGTRCGGHHGIKECR